MKCLHHLLETSARRWPERVAVEDPERGTQMTYRALDALADEIQAHLARRGVRSGDRVGVCLPKSIGAVATLFGILKAGAAYVPVDPDAPPSRNAYIFQDCAVRALVVDAPRVDSLRHEYGQALAEKTFPVPEAAGITPHLLVPAAGDPPPPEPAPNLAYILYTSGSTGRPKGVMHTHASALSFVDWCAATFHPDATDRFTSHAPFHFDLSILDLYVALGHGACLVLLGETLGKRPQQLAEVVAAHGITVWYSTPSILRLLVEYGSLDDRDCSALRLVLFAGEVFPIQHWKALKALWPHPTYYNLYGPTETNVCTYYRVPDEDTSGRSEPFPIGTTCANDRTCVADEHGRAVTPGEEGELYVSGGSVMQGYWNRPERTAAAFLIDEAGTRWYRTGDLVREDADGNYLFVGRRDRMIKRRGYRVELGEIEAALYRHPNVAEAAVVALPDEGHGVLVTAFLSWRGDEAPSTIRLKRFCAQHLPLYMIPDRFSVQSALPKTSTDKIDYQKLKTLT